MVTPRWVTVQAQPIAIGDVLAYLVAALDVPPAGARVFEIGGGAVTTYRGLMQEYARQRGTRRLFLPVPLLTPHLGARLLCAARWQRQGVGATGRATGYRGRVHAWVPVLHGAVFYAEHSYQQGLAKFHEVLRPDGREWVSMNKAFEMVRAVADGLVDHGRGPRQPGPRRVQVHRLVGLHDAPRLAASTA